MKKRVTSLLEKRWHDPHALVATVPLVTTRDAGQLREGCWVTQLHNFRIDVNHAPSQALHYLLPMFTTATIPVSCFSGLQYGVQIRDIDWYSQFCSKRAQLLFIISTGAGRVPFWVYLKCGRLHKCGILRCFLRRRSSTNPKYVLVVILLSFLIEGDVTSHWKPCFSVRRYSSL